MSTYYRNDSFSHRICDDLCEVLLSYLSFEDKIRFECVSKQFKRCVFVKQFKLNLCENKVLMNGNLINEKAYEIVLKKCLNISALFMPFSEDLTENTFKLITKYCLRLKEIVFDINGINEETVRQFGQKCGQKLEKINFKNRENDKNDNKYKTLIKFCPNLKLLFEVKLSDFIANDFILLPKLKEVFISDLFKRDSNKELFELFVNNYKKQMKRLDCQTHSVNQDIHKIQSFKAITRLEALEELSVVENGFPIFFDCMESIANHNKQLNKIFYRIQDSNTLYANRVFKKFNIFKNLKELTFYMSENILGNREITIKSLSDCKQLQKLSLMHPNINDNFFKDIHLYCPQLKSLEICLQSRFAEITDKAMESLAKLKHLKRLNLLLIPHNRRLDSITDSGLLELIQKSPQINSIKFNVLTNITDVTINALKELALSKPKTRFVHRLRGSFAEYEFDIRYGLEMPQNMDIICSKEQFVDSLLHNSLFTRHLLTQFYSSESDSEDEPLDQNEIQL